MNSFARQLLLVVLATNLFGCASVNNSQAGSGGSTGGVSPHAIVLENEKPGDPTWRITNPNPRN